MIEREKKVRLYARTACEIVQTLIKRDIKIGELHQVFSFVRKIVEHEPITVRTDPSDLEMLGWD
jgi:hypothetical protein